MNKPLQSLLNLLFGLFLGVFLFAGGLKADFLQKWLTPANKPEVAQKAPKPVKPTVLQAIIVPNEIPEPSVAVAPKPVPATTPALPSEVKRTQVEVAKPRIPAPVYLSKIEKKKNTISIVTE